MEQGDDFSIIRDESRGGMRHLTATPSALVCSVRIDLDLDEDGRIHNLRYERGCNGNLQAVGRLLEGMEAGKAAAILHGVNCNDRGTSCTDQLSRILSAAISK